ncbi:MAG: hypothetical protein ACHQK9_18120 [Reyranellales bacterium]
MATGKPSTTRSVRDQLASFEAMKFGKVPASNSVDVAADGKIVGPS